MRFRAFLISLKLSAIAFTVFTCALVGTSASVSAEVNLVFGTYAADKPTVTVKKYKPFLQFLARRMSVELGEPVTIRMKIAKTYSDGISQMASGDVDFSRFGPASYVTALRLNSDIQIIAMESKNGAKRFKGVIAVHKDSGVHSLSELRGHTFAFGDELSTIGRYLAQAHLLEVGISSKDLKHYKYLGRHDLVGEAVGARRFDAGALKESTFKKLVKKGVPIRALFEFDNVTKPWLAHPQMPPHVVAAMTKVMLSAEHEDIVQQIAQNGFLQGDHSDYDLVRQAMELSADF